MSPISYGGLGAADAYCPCLPKGHLRHRIVLAQADPFGRCQCHTCHRLRYRYGRHARPVPMGTIRVPFTRKDRAVCL